MTYENKTKEGKMLKYNPQYCTQNDGKCDNCSLVNYGLDCHNNPLTGDDIIPVPPEGIAGLYRGQIMTIHARAALRPGEAYTD